VVVSERWPGSAEFHPAAAEDGTLNGSSAGWITEY